METPRSFRSFCRLGSLLSSGIRLDLMSLEDIACLGLFLHLSGLMPFLIPAARGLDEVRKSAHRSLLVDGGHVRNDAHSFRKRNVDLLNVARVDANINSKRAASCPDLLESIIVPKLCRVVSNEAENALPILGKQVNPVLLQDSGPRRQGEATKVLEIDMLLLDLMSIAKPLKDVDSCWREASGNHRNGCAIRNQFVVPPQVVFQSQLHEFPVIDQGSGCRRLFPALLLSAAGRST